MELQSSFRLHSIYLDNKATMRRRTTTVALLFQDKDWTSAVRNQAVVHSFPLFKDSYSGGKTIVFDKR